MKVDKEKIKKLVLSANSGHRKSLSDAGHKKLNSHSRFIKRVLPHSCHQGNFEGTKPSRENPLSLLPSITRGWWV